MRALDLVPGWAWAAVCAALLAAAGGGYVLWQRAEARLAQYQAEVAQAAQQAEARARVRERQMQRKSEEVARDAAKREKELGDRLAAADAAVGGLRDEVSALNARAIPSDPGAAAFAGEARAARELLGACAARYRGVAAEAQGLSDQVTGLQQFVAGVCKTPAME